MINMHSADIKTLITGEVEKPAATAAGGDTADDSFLSFITGDDTELGRPDDLSDTDAGRSDKSVDIPESRAMFLSGMTDQKLAFVPTVGLLKLDDAPPVQNRSPEKTIDTILPDSLVGPNDDAPDIVPVKVLVDFPALQDTDTAVDVLRSMSETASIPPQVVVPDKQANAAIINDASKLASLPVTPVISQIDSGSSQHNVLPPTAAMPRPHMPVVFDPDLAPSPPANTVLPMATGVAPKIILDATLTDKHASGKQSRHASTEVTEAKENQRGQSMLLPQALKGAENRNAIIPPKANTIATPANQQPMTTNSGIAPDDPQVARASIQMPQTPPSHGADLPVVTSHPKPDILAPRLVNASKVFAPDNAQMTKAPNRLPRHMPNPPAGGMPSRVDPLQTPATISAPLQPTVLVPQSPKRQIGEGKLPEPDAQPVKQAATATAVQSTVPAVQTPITLMLDTPALEGPQPELTPEFIPLESRAADSTAIMRYDTIAHRPEVGRHIAQQLTDVARQMPDRPVELTLNPDELGRVRLTFTMSDGGIHVAVIAERGETMDLLRRHIETLAQEFRDMGYKDVNFDFSRNGKADTGQGDTNRDHSTSLDAPSTETEALAPVQLSLEPSTGLDLRL